MLVIISSMYVPICNLFHTKRANSGKNNVFLGGTPLLTPLFEEDPLAQGHKTCHKNLEVSK